MRSGNEEKRKQIIDSAIEAFATQGYYGTSIKDITDRAHISSGTFYLYFKGKDDLILTLFEILNQRMGDEMAEKIKEKYDNSIAKFVSCTCFLWKKFMKHKDLTTILLTRTIAISRQAESEFLGFFKKMCSIFEGLMKEIEGAELLNSEITSTIFGEGICTQLVLMLPCEDEDKINDCLYNILAYNFRAMSVEYSDDRLKEVIRKNMLIPVE